MFMNESVMEADKVRTWPEIGNQTELSWSVIAQDRDVFNFFGINMFSVDHVIINDRASIFTQTMSYVTNKFAASTGHRSWKHYGKDKLGKGNHSCTSQANLLWVISLLITRHCFSYVKLQYIYRWEKEYRNPYSTVFFITCITFITFDMLDNQLKDRFNF